MSNMNKGINAMPAPTSNKAPSFNGETSELLEFFEYFEDLSSACSLTDADKCKVIVRYVDKATKCFWITLAGYESHDYTAFKKSILAQYPGADKGIKYSRRELELVVASPSTSHSDEGAFARWACGPILRDLAMGLEVWASLCPRLSARVVTPFAMHDAGGCGVCANGRVAWGRFCLACGVSVARGFIRLVCGIGVVAGGYRVRATGHVVRGCPYLARGTRVGADYVHVWPLTPYVVSCMGDTGRWRGCGASQTGPVFTPAGFGDARDARDAKVGVSRCGRRADGDGDVERVSAFGIVCDSAGSKAAGWASASSVSTSGIVCVNAGGTEPKRLGVKWKLAVKVSQSWKGLVRKVVEPLYDCGTR
ncbi:hypothetical protein BU15DRAFT_64949 [Melanogaster broomeanus]|nr:hypothetical protein BU15DRAFT_64949 [Melanogaster broomeanus]